MGQKLLNYVTDVQPLKCSAPDTPVIKVESINVNVYSHPLSLTKSRGYIPWDAASRPTLAVGGVTLLFNTVFAFLSIVNDRFALCGSPDGDMRLWLPVPELEAPSRSNSPERLSRELTRSKVGSTIRPQTCYRGSRVTRSVGSCKQEESSGMRMYGYGFLRSKRRVSKGLILSLLKMSIRNFQAAKIIKA